MTATKACVPLVKMSASVSGMSVSENECVLRRNSTSTGQRSVTNTMMPSAHHQPTSGPKDRIEVADPGEVQHDSRRCDDGVQPPHRFNGGQPSGCRANAHLECIGLAL